MNKVIAYIVAASMGWLLSYLLLAFVTLEVDLFLWTSFERLALVVMPFFAFAFKRLTDAE